MAVAPDRPACSVPGAAGVLPVKHCPTCAREIADSARVCDACEAWAAAFVKSAPDKGPVSAEALAVDAAAPVAETDAAAPAAAPRARRQVMIAAGAVAAVALTGFVAISSRAGARPAPTTPATGSPAPAPAAAVSAAPPAADTTGLVQTWSTHDQASWLDNPRRGAAFELLSENVVKTWLGPVRPLLVVRCVSQRIEAFVVTGAPMKLDPRVEGKAVTISVDGESARTEHWVDSERHTSVFAPDAASFISRLRGARSLQFGYSPHNSGDVVAQFHVAGLDALINGAARHCGAAK